jgi:hypothetical protein
MPRSPAAGSGLDVGGAGAGQDLGQRVVGDEVAVAEQEQPVAAGGLVHDVAGDQQRRAAAGQVAEELPEVAAQHRVEPDRRLVQHEQLGAAEQGCGEGDPGALAAGQGAHALVLLRLEGDVGEDVSDPAAVGAEDVGEVVEVGSDGEVAIDGGGLGDVADAPPVLGCARGPAEDVDASSCARLDPDDRSHQRRLAAAARPEQTGHRAGGDGEGEPVQHLAPAARDAEVGALDR